MSADHRDPDQPPRVYPVPSAEQRAAWRLAPGIEGGFLNFEVTVEGSPPDLVSAIAGQLLDKGEDVNLCARVLDLAAKWAAVSGDIDTPKMRMMRICAHQLRILALLPPAPPVKLARGVHVYDSPEHSSGSWRQPEQVADPGAFDTLTDCPVVVAVFKPEEQA